MIEKLVTMRIDMEYDSWESSYSRLGRTATADPPIDIEDLWDNCRANTKLFRSDVGVGIADFPEWFIGTVDFVQTCYIDDWSRITLDLDETGEPITDDIVKLVIQYRKQNQTNQTVNFSDDFGNTIPIVKGNTPYFETDTSIGSTARSKFATSDLVFGVASDFRVYIDSSVPSNAPDDPAYTPFLEAGCGVTFMSFDVVVTRNYTTYG